MTGIVVPATACPSLFGVRQWWSGEFCLFPLPPHASWGPGPRPGGSKRGLAGASRRSRRRCRRWLENSVVRPYNFMTVTYPREHPDVPTAKTHLSALLRRLRAFGMETVTWVMEWQKRGAVHFHLVGDRYIDYKQFAGMWKISTRGLSDFEAGTEVRKVKDSGQVCRYMAKYLAKSSSKLSDMGPEAARWTGRLWGHVGNRAEHAPSGACRLVATPEQASKLVAEVEKRLVRGFRPAEGVLWGFLRERRGGWGHVLRVIRGAGARLFAPEGESMSGYLYRCRPSRAAALG